MGRMTRAKAAEVAERMHIDEDAVLDMSQIDEKAEPTTPSQSERSALGEIAPNSADGPGSDLVGRKTRSKKNVRIAAETKSEESQDGSRDEKSVVEQSEEDALEASTNEAMERLAKLRITSFGNQMQPTETPKCDSSSVAATLSDVIEAAPSEPINIDTVDKTNSESCVTTPTSSERAENLPSITIEIQSTPQGYETSKGDDLVAPEPPSSPVATAMPKVIKSLRTDTPGKRSTSNKENVEPIEPLGQDGISGPHLLASVSIAQDPSTSQSPTAEATQSAISPAPRHRSNAKSEHQIEALDNLDEAVEKVNEGIANVHSPVKTTSPKPAVEKEKPKKAKPSPVVRLTKATAARLSMAQGGNKDTSGASSTFRPRPSTMLGRANGARESVAPAAANKPSPKPRKETIIPHSKPRPVSLSFPTPPPAAKSSKAPTKSSFQLPGEAVAAKLKAAREERLKREAETAGPKTGPRTNSDEKRPAFKARPVPSSLKKTPSVRHTNASRARNSTVPSDNASKAPASTSTTSLKRSNTVATSRPRPSTAAAAAAAKPTPPAQLTVQKRARPSSAHVSTTDAAEPRKPSSVTARPSIAPASRTPSATSKGKEVYARLGAARTVAEQEKKEKEDAARKARAAAAERGRAASREWAQKQKVKNMVAKVEGLGAKA